MGTVCGEGLPADIAILKSFWKRGPTRKTARQVNGRVNRLSITGEVTIQPVGLFSNSFYEMKS